MREAAVRERLKAKQEGKFCRKSSFLGRRIDERAPAAGCPGARRGEWVVGWEVSGGGAEGEAPTQERCHGEQLLVPLPLQLHLRSFGEGGCLPGEGRGQHSTYATLPVSVLPTSRVSWERANARLSSARCRGKGDGKWQCLVELTGPKKTLTKHVILLKCKCLAKPGTYFLPSNFPDMSGMKSFLSVQGQEFEGFCKSKPSFGWKKKIIQISRIKFPIKISM